MNKKVMKAKVHFWPHPAMYSVEIMLPHTSFSTDSRNYKTEEMAKRAAESLAARMNWKLEWEENES